MAKKKDRSPVKKHALREVNLKLDPSVVTQLDALVGIANAADPGTGRWFRADLVELAVWKLHQVTRGDVESFKRLLKRSARIDDEEDPGDVDLGPADVEVGPLEETEKKGKGK